jgi:hypothetical protein
MRLDVMIQDFLYFILARSILYPAASAGADFDRTTEGRLLPSDAL